MSSIAPASPSAVSKTGKSVQEEIPDETEVAAVTAPLTEPANEEGKLRMILSLLKKFLNVKDIANVRLSLPASLLEPVPNLEYWTAGDRADLFASIGDSDDQLERFLAVLRFSFSIQLKFVRGKICKPYNSVLGEHFRCHWNVIPPTINPATLEPVIYTSIHNGDARDDPKISGYNTPSAIAGTPTASPALSATKTVDSETSSLKSVASSKSKKGTTTITPPSGIKPVKVGFVCEQVSHHPPISSAYYSCPEKGIEACGVDQISAKVSGMTVRIGPGSLNKGLFVRILRDGPGKGEEYQIGNPAAAVNGLLKGNFYGTILESANITCRGGDSPIKYRSIIEYKDESWISKPRFLLEGIVYKYKTGDTVAENYVKIKDVPKDMVVGTLEGCWRTQIRYKPKTAKAAITLIDMDVLGLIPKNVRPLESQIPFESRKLWDSVTEKLLTKQWGEATTAKQVIEQAQRDRAAAKKAAGEEYIPQYFEEDISDGRPQLTELGRKVLEQEFALDGYPLSE